MVVVIADRVAVVALAVVAAAVAAIDQMHENSAGIRDKPGLTPAIAQYKGCQRCVRMRIAFQTNACDEVIADISGTGLRWVLSGILVEI